MDGTRFDGWRRPGFRVLAAVAALAAPALSQEGGAGPDLAALQPVMAELRGGKWEAAKADRVARGLLSGGWPEAAGWWVAAAEKALEEGKLPATAKNTIGPLKTAWQKRAIPEGQGREVALNLAKHAKTIVALRNFAEGKKALEAAEKHLAVFPDSPALRTFEQAKAELARAKETADQNPKMLDAHRQTTAELAELSFQAVNAFFDDAVRWYEAAGCREGRLRIRKLATGFHGKDLPAADLERLRRINALARASESVASLQVWFCGDEPFRVFLDGARIEPSESLKLGERHTLLAFKLPVLSGDVVVFAPENETETKDGEGGELSGFDVDSVIGVEARLAGERLKGSVWGTCSFKHRDRLDPPTTEGLFGSKEKVDPADMKRLSGRRGEGVEFPSAMIRFGGSTSSMSRSFDQDLESVEAEFTKRELKPRWLAGRGRTPVVLLKVPL